MSRRILSLALAGFVVIVIVNWSCTKLDTTTIGSDLIPAVDNIKTFADTFAINTTQGVFADTTKLLLTDNYVFGKNVDPIFGTTEAKLFLQLKPPFYPYYIGTARDTLVSLDSVVLCLNYQGAYGDTTTSSTVQLQVNEVDRNAHGEWDSLQTLRTINYAPLMGAAISPVTTINLASLATYQKIGKGNDSVVNQIRIKLDNAFASSLFSQDSLAGGAFSRDTLFRAFNNGFAVSMISGGALLYTQLSDLNTRLEIHFKSKKFGTGVRDTSYATFTFNTGEEGSAAPSRSAVADNIVRSRPALPDGTQEIYLQTAPGTYASLKVPQLTGYTNRVIHRAEIIMEQLPGDVSSDNFFRPPGFLYLDLVDTGSTAKWKPVYYDLNPSVFYDPDNSLSTIYYPSEVDYNYFGALPKSKTDATSPSGSRLYYTINITRHLQRIVLEQKPNYEMRLFAPFSLSYPQYGSAMIPYPNNIAAGRIRLAGGNYMADPSRRMRLKIIYSKLD